MAGKQKVLLIASNIQVMIVKKDIKKYIGAVESEEKAARYYDKYALIIQGFDVRYLYLTMNYFNRPKQTFPTQRARWKNSYSATMKSKRELR